MEKTETKTEEAQTVSTVEGFVPLSNLGMILPHEHIPYCHLSTKYTTTKQKIHPFLNLTKKEPYVKCTWCRIDKDEFEESEKIINKTGEILINRGHHKMHPYTPISDHLCPHSYYAVVVEELIKARKSGVNTIVENTSYDLMRDISILMQFSKDTKINIIAGTGFYAANVQNESILSLSIEKMYNIMKKDLTQNLTSSENKKSANKNSNMQNVLAGFIGTVGISSPIHEFEKHSIRATAKVQSELGCPVSFSPAMGTCDYREVLRIYQEAGGKSDKVVMTHVDCTLKKTELMTFFDDTNCYIQFSMFGDEWSFNHRDDNLNMLSDAQRIKRLKLFKDKLCRILISHDIHTDDRMTHYGGHGYDHILRMKQYMGYRGLDKNDFTQITHENPKKWLFWDQQSQI